MLVEQKKRQKISSACLQALGIALLVRLLLSGLIRGFSTDINCFTSWADSLFSNGIGGFYSSGGFCDYPPGYLYVLWLLGGLRKLFGLTDYYAFASMLLIKFPAVLCDVISGLLIYRFGREKIGEANALICTLLYLFNPAIIINSAAWGQVDSIFTLFAVLTIYYIYKKKMPYAYIAFCIGILIKPQVAFIAPVLLLAIIEHVFMDGFTWNKFFRNLFAGLGSIAGLFLLMLPFGIGDVISQYVSTVTSYKFASVNAYNFWAMLGMNWKDQTTKVLGLPALFWGMFFVVCVFAFTIWFWWKRKKDRSKYFFMAAFLITGIFTLSVRMHERYMYPALILLILYYVVNPQIETICLYFVLSAVHFLNVIHVFVGYDPENYDWDDPSRAIIGAFMTLAFAFMVFCFFRFLKQKGSGKNIALKQIFSLRSKEADPQSKKHLFTSRPMARIEKKDVLIMLVITLLYSAVALFQLGDLQAPQSGWTAKTANEQYVFTFDEPVRIQKIWYYLGNYHNAHYDFEVQDADGTWIKVLNDQEFKSVFNWSDQEFTQIVETKAVRMTSLSNQASIWELTFVDEDGNYITPSNPEVCPALFDETDLIPERESKLNGTYFDEIYHARTAWEYTQGLYSYEWTHPPLGKIFIMCGILIFGMVPFGWRIAGTIFGIIMLPCIYVFAKKMFSKRWIATTAMLMFAADFMHFTQTRIATIDVFVTLFIILMYYYMYKYTQMSYYDRKFSKVMIPLGLSGMMMGFAMASKWTGVYAACGLAVIFFADLWRRYGAYRYAKTKPEGSTDGISHSRVIREFPLRTKQTILFCFLVFIFLPLLIYVLSYIPFVSREGQTLLQKAYKNAIDMYNYHSNLVSEHSYSSKWYQWPLMTRPMWYYSYHVSDTVSEGISAFGNPLIWWAGIPAFFYVLYRMIKNRDRNAGFLVIGYLAEYLPWMFVDRTTYIYHYFPSVPFVILMLCYSFQQFVKDNARRKYAVFVYIAGVIILFAMFYPVLSGYPVDKNFVFRWLQWFKSWVLVT